MKRDCLPKKKMMEKLNSQRSKSKNLLEMIKKSLHKSLGLLDWQNGQVGLTGQSKIILAKHLRAQDEFITKDNYNFRTLFKKYQEKKSVVSNRSPQHADDNLQAEKVLEEV
ncbi:hypothetical protein RFI_32238 [Reticulomyxa filosa]|uniref:Uncharacterized protein n=1 Tax=Reticulomyxa filosa TaxID=46433 RepID=X6LVH6_RETFI|nr:hypothetical protein RFI_32238 [Reticulomyxa filosa]|eukprot:ETO05157.1 hypothetical protein RFI_32238 [Reticulomyxa filosa]